MNTILLGLGPFELAIETLRQYIVICDNTFIRLNERSLQTSCSRTNFNGGNFIRSVVEASSK